MMLAQTAYGAFTIKDMVKASKASKSEQSSQTLQSYFVLDLYVIKDKDNKNSKTWFNQNLKKKVFL